MNQWTTVCQINDILPYSGICALVDEHHIAIFRPTEAKQLFAISNIDPFTKTSVLSQGLLAEHEGQLWVASPLKKQRFRLIDGYCLEDAEFSVQAYPVQIVNDQVQISIK
ncbi:MAG: nitrite reductase small subunit NirD [Candidatus Schmidhempelia sp.]|nr:nitrite reductase small subunit NirD [Candidatus Schmidhempelia sp.]